MCPYVQGGKRINPRPWTSQWHRIQNLGTLTGLSVAFVKWIQRSTSFHPVLIPPKGQMMGMVSWQGIFPNFTQSISCQSSLTQLDLMMEVGYKKPWRSTRHRIMQVAGFCLTTQSYKELRKGKGLQIMEMRATAAAISTTEKPNPSKGRMLSVRGGRRRGKRSDDHETEQESQRMCKDDQWWEVACQTEFWRCGCTRTEISPYLLSCFVQPLMSPSAWAEKAEKDRRDGEECSISNCVLWTGDLHHWDKSCVWEFKSTHFPTLWLVFALQREAWAAWHWISCCSCYLTEGPAACPHPGATSSSWRLWCYAGLWEGCRGNTHRSKQIWRSHSSGKGCRDDTAWHASAQITVQQHLSWWMSWRCCPLITASICMHDRTWNRYQVTTPTWGIEIRPCNVTSPTIQLLCKVQGRVHSP